MLSFRIERRFHFRQMNLGLYLELYNLYNRENIFRYYWNERTREQDTIDQYGFLPLLGLKMDF
jgi:hypothetical protein